MPSLRRCSLLAVPLLVAALAGAPTALADTTVVGETTLTPNSGNLDTVGENNPVFQGDASGNYVLSVTHAGAITAWSFLSGGAAPGSTFELRVLSPADNTGSNWRAIAESPVVTVGSATGVDAVNGPFTAGVDLPVSAGERIALQAVSGSSIPIESGTVGTDGIRYFAAPFNDGSSSTVISQTDNGQVVPIQATETYVGTPTTSTSTSTSATSTTTTSTSTSVAPIAPIDLTPPPTITGTARAGQTLTCNPGNWSGSPTFTYTWSESASTLSPGKPPKVTTTTSVLSSGQTLIVPDLMAGVTITCTVGAANAATGEAPGPKAMTAGVVVAASSPVLAPRTGLRANTPSIPSLVGGEATIVCEPGIWLHYPTLLTYAWYQVIPVNPKLGVFRLIHIGKGPQLQVPRRLQQKFIECRVTARNSAGFDVGVSNLAHVRPNAPVAQGPVRESVTLGTQLAFNPLSAPGNPLQPDNHGQFVFGCVAPQFDPSEKPTYQWQISLSGFLPGVAAAPGFDPDVTVAGENLTITSLVPLGTDPTGVTPARGVQINGSEQSYLGLPSPARSGGDGALALRCVVTATHDGVSSSVEGNVIYALAVSTYAAEFPTP